MCSYTLTSVQHAMLLVYHTHTHRHSIYPCYSASTHLHCNFHWYFSPVSMGLMLPQPSPSQLLLTTQGQDFCLLAGVTSQLMQRGSHVSRQQHVQAHQQHTMQLQAGQEAPPQVNTGLTSPGQCYSSIAALSVLAVQPQ